MTRDGRSGHGAPHGVLDLVQRGGSTCLFLFSMTYLFSVNAADAPSAAVAPVILSCSFLFSRGVSLCMRPCGKNPHELGGAGETSRATKAVTRSCRGYMKTKIRELQQKEYRQANLKASFPG